MSTDAHIVRWETPFTSTAYPSVGVFIESDTDGIDTLSLVVAPDGIDKYPKYLVRFSSVVAYTYREESFAPSLGIEDLTFEDRKASAQIWPNSPWIESYRQGEGLLFEPGHDPLEHFMFFGGDNIVEVISMVKPKIEEIAEPRTINLEYKV